MSLLQELPQREYERALQFSTEKCIVIAKLANLNISFNEASNAGKLLIKNLDRRGFSFHQYKRFLSKAQSITTIVIYFKPHSKIAILIANDKYTHLSKLATPSVDCDSLARNLINLGFISIKVKNTTSGALKNILKDVFNSIPENSYCFIFYAGHGCELCNTKFMLGVDCPTDNIEMDYCVTENYVLKQAAECKPELCILIMDMCRVYLDRDKNPQIYTSLSEIEEYMIHSNLLIAYSTQSSQSAYEVVQIECSQTISNDMTYQLKTGDTSKIVTGGSQYVNALCTRLSEGLDFSSLLDKVHEDVENSWKKQKPIKIQCGVAKRSLYDPATGDKEAMVSKLKSLADSNQYYKAHCEIDSEIFE